MKVLLIGSRPPPYHGQSIAFESAISSLEGNDVRIINSSFRGSSIFVSLYNFLEYVITLPYVLLTFRPDCIYFLCSRSVIGAIRDMYLLLLVYYSTIEVCNHLHGSDLNDLYVKMPRGIQLLFAKLYSRIDKNAVLVDEMKEQFDNLKGSHQITVIPNFYTKIPDQFIIKKDFNVENIRVVYLSSIMESKGIFDVIYAIDKIVNDDHINVTLSIAGGVLGDEVLSKKEAVNKFNSTIQNKPYLEYLGIINDKEKYELLSASHIFVLPSYYKSEAIPLSIIEAMRMGCCIITTNYKYLPSLVKDGVNGLIVPIHSPNDIYNKILELECDRSLMKIISNNNTDEAIRNYSESVYKNNIRHYILDDE